MCPIAGGNWNNAAIAGVWALNFNNSRTNSNNNVGFRADSDLPNAPNGDGGAKGDDFRQETAKSECSRLSCRALLGVEGQAA